MRKIRNIGYSLLAVLVSGQAALAAQNQAPPITNPIQSSQTFGEILNNAINGFLIFAGAVAVLFLIVGGFRYVVSTGNPDQVEGAKKTILYSILGLVIIFIAFLLVNVVLADLLGAKGQFTPKPD